jgi:hypothetical protein
MLQYLVTAYRSRAVFRFNGVLRSQTLVDSDAVLVRFESEPPTASTLPHSEQVSICGQRDYNLWGTCLFSSSAASSDRLRVKIEDLLLPENHL